MANKCGLQLAQNPVLVDGISCAREGQELTDREATKKNLKIS